jgi:hypothetical protein
MKPKQQIVLFAAASLAIIASTASAGAFAGNDVAATTDPNFVPDTGAINRGFDEPVPSISHERQVPTAEEIRSALKMPDSDQPSLGVSGNAPNATTTIGSGVPNPANSGPIAATGQTMPAKFSTRNDILDRTPIMALSLTLSDEDRSRIFQAVMAEKTPPAPNADTLAPASELDSNMAVNYMRPLPESVRNIQGVQSLAYVKSKNKIFLVRPANRVVIDEIGS